MSPGQAERFGGDPIRFAKGPCCVLLVRRNDDRSPYDALRELGLETIYFTESPYAALRARVALFPGAKQFERTFAIATGDQAVAQLDEIAARDGYLVTYREQRPLSAIEAAALEVELSFEQKTWDGRRRQANGPEFVSFAV